jgi:hypothetical protein
MSNTDKLNAQVENLKKRGVALPKNPARAQMAAASMHQMALTPGGPLKAAIGNSAYGPSNIRVGQTRTSPEVAAIDRNNELIRSMGQSRRLTRTASGGGGGGDAYSAVPRFYDPLEFWDLNGLPWNVADEGHRHKLHKWLRLFYSTHYLVPILIDIFTRFPLVGMELDCKDKRLENFYSDLFLDQLNYPEFLVSLGREYWTVGEAFPLGSFDEDLGIWEREELLNPEDVVIENFPLLGSRQMKIVPPDYLKKLAQTKSPAKEFAQLEMNYPELIPYLRRNEHIPISDVLLKQVANTLTDWDDHGTPILLRGLRTLIHEEKLLASQDAIAERLYSPLILAKLGIMDLGDGQGAWVPGPDELDAFRDDMDIALSSDFRLLVHHFGLDVTNVFGREQMPRLGDDFDRIERRIMQIFGVNPSLLSAGSGSQPYASSALQAEFLNQILKTFQGYLKKHYMERAYVVAEAQEHWEYEKRGDVRVPVMEEVIEYDEEGNKHIVKKNKLLIPDLNFQTLDLRDEATQRQFFQTLRAMGVPIPDQKLMIGVKYDVKELVEEYNEELMTKTIAQQQAKVKTWMALDRANLPIPPDLDAEVRSVMGGTPAQPPQPAPGGPGGAAGGPPPAGGPAGAAPAAGGGAPGAPGGKIVMPPAPAGMGPTGGGPAGVPGGGPPPMAGNASGIGNGFAPPASFERRPGMPTASSVEKTAANDLNSDEDAATLGPNRTRVENETETVHELPKAKNKKSYSFVTEELVEDSVNKKVEEDEPTTKSAGESQVED